MPQPNSPERAALIRQLFEGLSELSEADRAEFLDRVCRDDPSLRDELTSLLEHADFTIERFDTFASRVPLPALVALRESALGAGNNPVDSLVGKRIFHFEIIERIGRGGMGEVFLARDRKLERQVAMKLLPLEWVDDTPRRHRFLREARAASALNHPNVCIIHEVGESTDGRPYVTMEYLEGATLNAGAKSRSFSILEIVDIAIQIADALEAASDRGVVHRDLKPGNISISDRGLVKVLDFGLAKVIGGEPLTDEDARSLEGTLTGQILGTPNYMSPEQTLGRTVDHRSDLFSLGVVLYELLTGRLPFSGATIGEIVQGILNAQPEAIARFNYDIPDELDRIVRKLLEKEPENRYQGPSDLLVDLRHLKRDLSGSGTAGREAGDAAGRARQREVAQDFAQSSAQSDTAEIVPAGERAERQKLAAVMFTDMVGYSALAGRNEALALELLDPASRPDQKGSPASPWP